VLVVKNTTRKNIGDFVVYHKGLSFVVNATRVSISVPRISSENVPDE